jgi:signal transduction histidine kinase/CheY-like chemotaxis protein
MENKLISDLQLTVVDDLRDDRAVYLNFVLPISVAIGGLLFAFTTQFRLQADGILLAIWVMLFGSIGISFLLRHKYRVDAAAWTYLVGFAAAMLIYVAAKGEFAQAFVILLVPLMLSHLLLDYRHVMSFAVLVAAGALAAMSLWVGFFPALMAGFGYYLLYLLLGFIGMVNSNSMVERVAGSIDSATKGTVRGDYFYAQGERLKEAMLELQKSRSAIERANADLAQAQARAEAASNAKSIFLSNVSHELRTPLNVVIGYAGSLLRMPHMFANTPLPQVHRPYVEMIEDNGQYLLGLINDLLDMSKIEAGKLEIQPGPTALDDLFRNVMATAVGLVKDKPIQMRVDYPDDLPLAMVDARRVRQVLLNLLSNAVKFTVSGSVTLSARADMDFIHISVTDTGIGIPAAALEVIFDRFEQAERDTDRKYGGTGLGLDISRQLVLMHGGDLTVMSEVGHGSTFTLTLPIAEMGEQHPTQPNRQYLQTAHVFEQTQPTEALPEQLVLVESNQARRQRWMWALEAAGYAVLPVTEGANALEAIEGLLPALIICAEVLPDMSGQQMLAQVRSNVSIETIPVLLSSSTDASGIIDGCTAVVSSDAEPAQLLIQVRALLAAQVLPELVR